MSNETIADLRTHLFAALRGLSDKVAPMEIERARAVADVAQTIINSAKVEVEHMKVAGGTGSGFIPDAAPALPGMPAGTTVIDHGNGVRVTRHKLQG
jgi:hypothetical protein